MNIPVLSAAFLVALFLPLNAYSGCTEILSHHGENMYISISDGGCGELTVDFTNKFIFSDGGRKVDYKSVRSFPFDEECTIKSSDEIYMEILSCHAEGRTPLAGTTYKRKKKDNRYFCITGCREDIPLVLGYEEDTLELSLDSCLYTEFWSINNSEGDYIQVCKKTYSSFTFEANGSESGKGIKCNLVGEATIKEKSFIYSSSNQCLITFSPKFEFTKMDISFSEGCSIDHCEQGVAWKNGEYELSSKIKGGKRIYSRF